MLPLMSHFGYTFFPIAILAIMCKVQTYHHLSFMKPGAHYTYRHNIHKELIGSAESGRSWHLSFSLAAAVV